MNSDKPDCAFMSRYLILYLKMLLMSSLFFIPVADYSIYHIYLIKDTPQNRAYDNTNIGKNRSTLFPFYFLALKL